MKKHVILFLAANPRISNPLRLAEECAEIQRELKMSPHRDDFQFESRWAVSIDELMRHLNELVPTVIHFAGHGAGKPAGSATGTQRDIVVPGATGGTDGGIYLQDEQGQPQLVSPRALAMMIKAAGGSARVVVLNACYTAAQADVLRDKVECIVGMDGAIEDDAARAFAMRFYGALGNRLRGQCGGPGHRCARSEADARRATAPLHHARQRRRVPGTPGPFVAPSAPRPAATVARRVLFTLKGRRELAALELGLDEEDVCDLLADLTSEDLAARFTSVVTGDGRTSSSRPSTECYCT